jgi:predicted transcriptional regulator
MHVPFTPEEEARFAKLASAAGKTPEQLAHDILTSVAVAEDEAFQAAVRLGTEQADRGELIEETSMDERIGRNTPLVKRIRGTSAAKVDVTMYWLIRPSGAG